MENLFDYYENKDIRPTYAAFKSLDQLNKYDKQRKDFFYKLNLPYTFFKDKNVIEFGPDTGENALVFARWGSRLCLVEPNLNAHNFINEYFKNFKLSDSIEKLIPQSLSDFKTVQKFDIVVAEGFIYTIKPTISWIKKAKECLNEDGLFIFSFYDYYGGYIELLQKAIYNIVNRSKQININGIELAKSIFTNKWEGVGHTRSINSWFMDVIENPFVRLKYFIDPITLMNEMFIYDMRLYSSWPISKYPYSVNWIKKNMTSETDLLQSIKFTSNKRLSHFLGYDSSIKTTEVISNNLKKIIEITDNLIDNDSSPELDNIINLLKEIIEFCKLDGSNSAHNEEFDILNMILSIFDLLKHNKITDLIKFCQNDKTFLNSWGAPNNNAIYQNTIIN